MMKAAYSTTDSGSDGRERPSPMAPTVSHLLGEMTWLLTQSPLHRAFAIGDLEWLLMPALIHQQFYIFRDGEKPVGLALWANCSPQAAGKLDRGLAMSADPLTLEEWNSGDELWLIDLVAPFATAENRQREIMIADLISKPLAGKEIKLHQIDPKSGKRSVNTIGADAAAKMREAILSSLAKIEK